MTVNKRTSNSIVHGELGRHSLDLKVNMRMINFWVHLPSGNTRKYFLKTLITIFSSLNGS